MKNPFENFKFMLQVIYFFSFMKENKCKAKTGIKARLSHIQIHKFVEMEKTSVPDLTQNHKVVTTRTLMKIHTIFLKDRKCSIIVRDVLFPEILKLKNKNGLRSSCLNYISELLK